MKINDDVHAISNDVELMVVMICSDNDDYDEFYYYYHLFDTNCLLYDVEMH